MASLPPSSPVRVRYCLRSICSPLLLTGCIAQLSGSLPAAGIILILGLILTFLIIVRPYMEVTDGDARYVGLLTGRRMAVEDLGWVLSSKTLRWFVRRGDMDKVRQLLAGAAPKRVVTQA
ncbi:hypothetical protein OVA24_10960 [Luteolibacter sp. SL250]|uniref:hypothetical protein n=1 Tax=Luteolibacter sp. SL250 TaxID=2995170 RepID=UPI00226FD13E|nr:hypothetical protein [Luteolibacter sp. SL250]WAC17762.1 hypothetical protein OVA24_10960 [Luteolibacter sp. SL250]